MAKSRLFSGIICAQQRAMQIFAPLTSEQTPGIQRIEIASSFQLPSFQIIGLPAPEVAEAKERIRAALESSGFDLPKRRIVVNLSPASIRKRGTGLDLSMALAVLAQKNEGLLAQDFFVAAWGELGLDGSVKSAGQHTRALFSVWQARLDYLFIPESEFQRMQVIQNMIAGGHWFQHPSPVLVPVRDLQHAWRTLNQLGSGPTGPMIAEAEFDHSGAAKSSAFEEVELQYAASRLLPLSPSLERAVSVAALGQHHLLLIGAKGVGKSHAMEWLIQLQPECSDRMKIHRALLSELVQSDSSTENPSHTGVVNPVADRVVRRVSPTVRPSALIGSATNSWIRPGEFALAHGGLLIADEFPEWARDSREALREPLESGRITVTRAKGSVEFLARFSLAANGNFCPCGGWPPDHPVPMEIQNSGRKLPRCTCSLRSRKDYRARLSGPILDRMDLVLVVGSHLPEKKTQNTQELLKRLRTRIMDCQQRAKKLWGTLPGFLTASETEALIAQNKEWEAHLNRLNIGNLRARHKTVRLALSLALWDEQSEPGVTHFLEASSHRPERFGVCE
jgi:magnesium chelatase family protein